MPTIPMEGLSSKLLLTPKALWWRWAFLTPGSLSLTSKIRVQTGLGREGEMDENGGVAGTNAGPAY